MIVARQNVNIIVNNGSCIRKENTINIKQKTQF